MTSPASRAIPLQVLSDPAVPQAPLPEGTLQVGTKQLGGDKIGRSPV